MILWEHNQQNPDCRRLVEKQSKLFNQKIAKTENKRLRGGSID